MTGLPTFKSSLKKRWREAHTQVCVGLDSDYQRLPGFIKDQSDKMALSVAQTILLFNKRIIDETAEFVCCFKLQFAFYAAIGEEGTKILQQTIEYIHNTYSGMPVILDAKRSDVSSTMEKYSLEVFDHYNADAVTLVPFFGKEAYEPFLKMENKGIFFICHSSNPGASEFQEVSVLINSSPHNSRPEVIPFYQLIAQKITNEWNENGNCGVIVGATYPAQLLQVREIVGNIPILIPGIGAQEGDLKKTVLAGRDSNGEGMIISSSRSVIYTSDGADFANGARKKIKELRDKVNSYL